MTNNSYAVYVIVTILTIVTVFALGFIIGFACYHYQHIDENIGTTAINPMYYTEDYNGVNMSCNPCDYSTDFVCEVCQTEGVIGGTS